MRILVKAGIWMCVFFFLTLALIPARARASGTPERRETLRVGSYSIQVILSPDPPEVEMPLTVTVSAQGTARLTGRVIALPGPGTDATPSKATLTPVGHASDTLACAVHLPVRGAWQIIIDLDGPRGPGSVSLDVTVTAPNAIPSWLGWLIGLSPLLGCGWLVWRQWKYRRRLLTAA